MFDYRKKKPCSVCRKRKYHYSITMFIDGELTTICENCQFTSLHDSTPVIDKKESRAKHWNEIRTRVTTHEGELLHGKAGADYQKKWSQRYLGRNLGSVRPVTSLDVERYEHTK